MNAQEFRTHMIERIRAFDKWAYKDQLDNPEEYAEMDCPGWWKLFQDFVENSNV